ncbi:MAG: phage tail tube protein [Aeromicrobium sp.]
MAEPIRPAATKLYGRENWVFIPDVADINAITVTEWAAASSLDITRVAFASTGKPSQSTNRVTAERRLGDTKTYESIGTSNVTGGDLLYAFGDQAAAGSDEKKFYEMIPEGTTGVLVNRRGVPRATAATAGQFYHAYPVEFGPSFPASAGDGEAGESAMVCAFAVTDEPAISKTLVAGA